jgi:hypothetical protein
MNASQIALALELKAKHIAYMEQIRELLGNDTATLDQAAVWEAEAIASLAEAMRSISTATDPALVVLPEWAIDTDGGGPEEYP